MWNALVRRRNRRKLFAVTAVVLGFILVLVAMEFSLRLMGWWSVRRGPLDPQNLAKVNFIILCTGDSHTYGKGAPAGFDYPAQLSARLSETHPGLVFAVVNLGHAGDNSSQAVNRVLKFMKDMPRRPNLIIFNAGKNNDHNFAEARILPAEVGRLNMSEQIKYLLANSRAFRLGQISVSRLQQLLDRDVSRQSMHWDRALDVRGEAEQELIRDWIRRDIEYLLVQTAGLRAPIVLLNYWSAVDMVDQVFTEMAKVDRITFIDVRRFGFSLRFLKRMGGLIAPDWHPNQYGYGLIARLVYQGLLDHGLIPPPE